MKFKQKYPNGHKFPPFQWQESFYDHTIRNDRDFNAHMDYIEYNPIKHGLPDDWPYIYTRPYRHGRVNPKYEDLTDDSI